MSTDETLVQLDFDEPHHDLLIDRNGSGNSNTNNGTHRTHAASHSFQQQRPINSNSALLQRLNHHQQHDVDDIDDHYFGSSPSSQQQQQQRPGVGHQFAAAIPPQNAAAVHVHNAPRGLISTLANDHRLLQHLSGDTDDRHSIISLTSSSAAEDVCLVPEVGFADINLADHGDQSRESQPLLGGGGVGARGDHADQLMFNYFPGNITGASV